MAVSKLMKNTFVNSDREQGLRQWLSQSENLDISISFNTDWNRDGAVHTTEEIFKRYPDIDIIWTVADALALGVRDVMQTRNNMLGKDVLLSGFDWSQDSLEVIRSGKLDASIGGHFMEAGWALIMIYDYHNGIDFDQDPGISTITPMSVITENNVDEYIRLFGDRKWSKIDFKKFSKKLNPGLKKYDLSLASIFASMKKG